MIWYWDLVLLKKRLFLLPFFFFWSTFFTLDPWIIVTNTWSSHVQCIIMINFGVVDRFLLFVLKKTLSWRRLVHWRRTNDFLSDIDIRIFVGRYLLRLVKSTVSPTHWTRVWRWDFSTLTLSFYFVFASPRGLPMVVFLEACTSGRIWMLFAHVSVWILFIIDIKQSWNEILTNGDSHRKALF